MGGLVTATGRDVNAKVSANDIKTDFLTKKFAAGTDIVLTILNPGENEKIEIKSTAEGQNFSFAKVSAMTSKVIKTDQQMIFSGIFEIDGILDLQGELVLI